MTNSITAPIPAVLAVSFKGAAVCTTGAGVGVFKLPAGRGVTDGVGGGLVGVRVRVGSGVGESRPVTVEVTVGGGVNVNVGVVVAGNGV